MNRLLPLLLTGLLLAAPFAPARAGVCTGSFVNPITDICWDCIFPISIGPIEVFGERPDPVPLTGLSLRAAWNRLAPEGPERSGGRRGAAFLPREEWAAPCRRQIKGAVQGKKAGARRCPAAPGPPKPPESERVRTGRVGGKETNGFGDARRFDALDGNADDEVGKEWRSMPVRYHSHVWFVPRSAAKRTRKTRPALLAAVTARA